jgi:DNA-binding transcriptional LysR family regulator
MMIARKYLYLIALAREKHFGRAALACHISPSTLSAAIISPNNTCRHTVH